MGSQENGERALFEQSCTGMDAAALMPDNVVAGMPICPESIFKSPTCLDPFWDPIILGIQGGKIGNSCMVLGNEFGNTQYSGMLENQAAGSSSHLPQFPSNPCLVELMPRIPNFGSGNFSDMLSAYNVDESVSRSSFPPNQGGNLQCQNLPNGKRKRKNVGGDPSGNALDSPKEDGEKQSNGADPCRQAGKQIKDINSELSKENYIHVRAKRGQATNSHSLAERVRREKISERMKLLQELVPGCNKITGKAVMLDEIINYVQSLQQQVEFLSMKLATVNPELNVDIENMLSKDILQSRGGSAGPGISSSHPFAGLPLGTINGFPGTAPPFHPLPQNLWSNELQGILQMGYDSNPSSVSSLATNGLSKMEP